MPILTAQERVGTLLDGKIRLDRILGEGGMGVVYGGTHLGLDRPVAVKFLHGQLAQHPEVVGRFVTEAKATSRLHHPNVIDVRDVGTSEDGCAYMVLEFLKGESLGTHLESQGALSLAEAVSILVPVMDALGAAHAAGIIHRDIKPDNVFLSRSPDGRVVPKVLDFGIAKLADAQSASATATGAVMGTPYYMAPEQAMGRKNEIGPWSDVWSMAVMTFECLAGRLPFRLGDETTMAAVLLALMTSEILPLTRFRSDLPVAVEQLLAAALQRDPSRRIRSMNELREGLLRASAEAIGGPGGGGHAVPGMMTGPLVGAAPFANQAAAREHVTHAPTVAASARETAPSADITEVRAPEAHAARSEPGIEVLIETADPAQPPSRRRALALIGGAVVLLLLVGGIGAWTVASSATSASATGAASSDERAPERLAETVLPVVTSTTPTVPLPTPLPTPSPTSEPPASTEPPLEVAGGDAESEVSSRALRRDRARSEARGEGAPAGPAERPAADGERSTPAPTEATTAGAGTTQHRGGSVSLDDF